MAGLAAIVLADSRFPGGGHVHSGGLEEAVARGLVTGLDDLASFLLGRLRTTGLVAAGFAAAAARLANRSGLVPPRPGGSDTGPPHAEGAGQPPTDTARAAQPPAASPGEPPTDTARAAQPPAPPAGDPTGPAARAIPSAGNPGDPTAWAALDAELDARTPSPAQRAASRAQGRASLRAARRAWPSPVLDALVAAHPRPHHPLLVGAVIGMDGGTPADAARCAGYLAVTGPAAAAVRLLGLDPLAVNALVVGLGPVLAEVVATAQAGLPAAGAPVLDLMAQSHVRHHREQVRLFAS